MTESNFYTYAYLREDGTPYYVGKGTGRRCFQPHGKTPVPEDRSKILLLKQNLTEEEAFEHEIYMISILGRKTVNGGLLINFTDGGEGHSGFVQSEETKQKRARSNSGRKRTPEQCARISASKRGKGLSDEHKASISQTLAGHTQSLETRAKRSAALKGRPLSPEHRAKLKKK
jgi:hypothetical protein